MPRLRSMKVLLLGEFFLLYISCCVFVGEDIN